MNVESALDNHKIVQNVVMMDSLNIFKRKIKLSNLLTLAYHLTAMMDIIQIIIIFANYV